MSTPIHPDVVGQDFDRWLDWEGAAGEQSPSLQDGEVVGQSTRAHPPYPISPASATHSDYSSAFKSITHTAPSTAGPLTPTQSAGSPDTFAVNLTRLSGDTLRDGEVTYQQSRLKRKSSASQLRGREERTVKSKSGGSKRPHNVIEKRYRANLNDKIAELRDSVPALRVLHKSRNKDDHNSASDEEDLDGLVPSGKLNKASILTKAVEYIRHLEFRNKRLEAENHSLKDRLQTLDRVIAQGGTEAQRATAFTTDSIIEEHNHHSHGDDGDPQAEPPPAKEVAAAATGRIPVPQEWQRMTAQTRSPDHYGHVYQNPSEKSRIGGKWTSRIMLGSLAGLMLMEGFSESDQGTNSKQRGLFGIPVEILDGWTFLRSPRIYLATFAEYYHAGGIVPLLKGFSALTILAFLIFAYLFHSKPPAEIKHDKRHHRVEEPQAARPASPIEVRRRAWSTSMQALRLPHHSFFPEWLAVTSEWIKYTARYLIGRRTFTSLTSRSSEDEVARIKAWDIAIDAQLAGGDIEVSRSRVVLTIFGSGTLPATPLRLMQKSLHCRVLLWNLSRPASITTRCANYVATCFANRQWRKARQLHEQVSATSVDRLPVYLHNLLQMDGDDVFNSLVVQRASNLMYDRPTSEYAENDLMDVIVEDHAIRSPLDAIAAWRSTCALQEALNAALHQPDSPDLLREHVQAALEVAPPGSTAEIRALAVHAVLSPGRRAEFLSKATDALATERVPHAVADNAKDEQLPFFIDSSTPLSARPDIATCLQCAKIMLSLEQERNLDTAAALLSSMSQSRPECFSLLTAAAQFFVLYRFCRAGNSDMLHQRGEALARQLHHFLAAALPGSVPSTGGSFACLEFLASQFELRIPSAAPSRRYSMISNDTGYVSLSDLDEAEKSGVVAPVHELQPSVLPGCRLVVDSAASAV